MTGNGVLDRIREAVIELDDGGRVSGWHGGAEYLLGWTGPQMLGQDLDERLAPRDSNGNPCCIGPSPQRQRMPSVHATPEQEFQVATKSRRDVWVGVTCTFQRDAGGRIASTVIVMRDIGRRKRIDMAKSEVISAVAHELRSPLTSVKGFTATLIQKWDRINDETKRHLLSTINTDADRVTRLIGELLDVSRLEAGRLELRRQMIDIAAIAARVIESLDGRSDEHRIVRSFSDDLPEVYADADKVEQVLTNFVENALKYTASGEVTVGASWTEQEVEVWVTDEGEGVPTEHRLAVFAKFFRRPPSSVKARNPSGTGLGLYISKGLVEAQGGRIWVEDSAGGGARFAFKLPRTEPH